MVKKPWNPDIKTLIHYTLVSHKRNIGISSISLEVWMGLNDSQDPLSIGKLNSQLQFDFYISYFCSSSAET